MYQEHLAEVRSLGASLIAISPNLPDHSLSMVEKAALEYDVLSDEGNQVAARYGLNFVLSEPIRSIYAKIGADLTTFNGDPSWELPMPGTFVIDRDRTVRLAFVDADYTKRMEPDAILGALRDLTS